MALISPGVEVTVIDESQYTPTAQATVAYVLLATEQDKLNTSGTIASATTAANAGKIVTVTNQRELVSLFGTPSFQVDASDNPINADERNEYGLLAAYSALGVSNKVYIQRANVDLAQLEGTSIRPNGDPVDGTYWLDLDSSRWGIYEWTENGFVEQTPIIITDSAYLDGSNVPLSSLGAIGSYALVATTATKKVYYKGYDNYWYLVGSEDWDTANHTIQGTTTNPTLVANSSIRINGSNIPISGTTVSSANTAINSANITGVTSRVDSNGSLRLYVDRTAKSDGSNVDGAVKIQGNIAGGADASGPTRLGFFTAAEITANLHITGKTTFCPQLSYGSYREVPEWRPTDDEPRPWGSVWLKTSATGRGASWSVKKYSQTTNDWTTLSTPMYASDNEAIRDLDPTGGGVGIAAGTVYVRYDYDPAFPNTTIFRPFYKSVAGLLKITGTTLGSGNVFTSGHYFRLTVSDPQSDNPIVANVVLSGQTTKSFVQDILSHNVDNLVATVESSGAISLSHLAGGTIQMTNGSGTALTTSGLILDSKVQEITAGSDWIASPFKELIYISDTVAPYSDPVDGTLWYYNSATDVDIMINDGTAWKGYRMVSNDARGYDLSATDPNGPILSASQPTYQSNGTTQVVAGELWIDTSDLENYPVIRRYNGSTWELIDNTDQIGVDGILFADARWDLDGTTNPITDDLVSIADLANWDYIDADCPDYRLYARGTLLWNTRRSGFNVKRFESTWHADAATPPTELGAWVTNSGENPTTGIPYFGHKAQRGVVVEALKSAIESSTVLREEQTEFNLITCPGYPELMQNMITLNNDRKQTAFIIGDSPLTLNSASSTLDNWAKNSNLAVENGLDGLVSRSEYLGVFYPSGFGTDLGGESVIVPPSHMMLRTILRSDQQSYPWFAPAGVRRGVIDNVTAIGYVDTTDDNVFRSIGVTQGLRDILYANNVNPITVLPGVGLVNYGQKTRASTTSAMDRINVARLVCYLRTVLDKVARPFIFEPNDTITRNQVKQAFEAVLNDLVAKRGITDYLVVCDTTNNTPDRIDRNELYVDIAIEPMKAIEFIYIPVRLKNTGDIAAGL